MNYYSHLVQNPNSLIVKLFGCYKVRFIKGEYLNYTYFIIMNNVFNTTRHIDISYDLKGSTQGRITKSSDPSIAKKDLNILENGDKISLNSKDADEFVSQLQKDTEFLMNNDIIDYSLLMGIHKLDGESAASTVTSSHEDNLFSIALRPSIQMEEKTKDVTRDCLLSSDSENLYYLGIIDILTEFSSRKKFEYYFKRLILGKGISCVPSKQYGERFIDFIKNLTIKGENIASSPSDKLS